MFNTATKAQMQELIEYIASKMSVIDVSTIADANNVEEGYFNETDNKFYKEADYTTEITGKNKTIYISLNTDLPYYFNGTNFVVLSSKFSRANLYSTDEKIVGEWIDGKPLYQKVITVNGTFNTMDAEVVDTSSLNIEELVDLRTLDHSHFGSAKFAIIPFAHPEGNWSMTVYINNNNKICVCPGNYISLVNPTFILQYTKTTD